MITRYRHWMRVYRNRGAATLPFWAWFMWVVSGELKDDTAYATVRRG